MNKKNLERFLEMQSTIDSVLNMVDKLITRVEALEARTCLDTKYVEYLDGAPKDSLSGVTIWGETKGNVLATDVLQVTQLPDGSLAPVLLTITHPVHTVTVKAKRNNHTITFAPHPSLFCRGDALSVILSWPDFDE